MFFLIKGFFNHLIFVSSQTEKMGPGFGFDSKDNGLVSIQAKVTQALNRVTKR